MLYNNTPSPNTFYINADLHTHTCASGHGTLDSITKLAAEAARRQMRLLGISDHGPATPGSAGLSYFRSLILCERSRFGVELRYGAEANILDTNGSLDIPDDILKTLDYCIISMHRNTYTPGSLKENTLAYIHALRHNKVRFIGHCDDPRFPVDFRELAKAALSAGVVPELNNTSLAPDSHRGDCLANAAGLLDACASLSCPVILSSDSHGHEHIGEVAEAVRLVQETGFPETLVQNRNAPFGIL